MTLPPGAPLPPSGRSSAPGLHILGPPVPPPPTLIPPAAGYGSSMASHMQPGAPRSSKHTCDMSDKLNQVASRA